MVDRHTVKDANILIDRGVGIVVPIWIALRYPSIQSPCLIHYPNPS